MDGLEISEISFSELHKPLRIEAEYYRKSYLKLEGLIKSRHSVLLSTLTSKITDGTHYTPSYVECGVPFLSALNVLENRLDIGAGHQFISLAEHNELYRRCDPIAGDILLRKVGVGPRWAAVVPEGLPVFSVFVSVALLRPRRALIKPEVLATFINSRSGQTQLLRVQKGASQPDLHLEDIRDIQIPVFEQEFQNKIMRLHQQAIEQIAKGAGCYKGAELTLNRALGLENWQPTNQRDSIKNFSQFFAVAGRLDAEYYQPKYDAWAERIKQCPAGFDELGTTCQIKEANFSPDDAQTYRYIELSDIGSHGNITGATEDIGAALPTRARRRVAIGDVVVSSIEGSLQSVALVTDDYDNALCSTGFYVVRSDTINAETLLVLFKSEAYQNLFKQACTGTILTAMPKEFFGRIPVPVIDTTVQQSIAEKVQASFAARRQSQQLLELAKQTVERAIESSEAEALAWLKTQMRQVA